MTVSVEIAERWRTAYPGAHIGILAMRDVRNPASCEGLEREKAALEARLHTRYADLDRAGIKALPVIEAYNAYYKPFRKTYHVQHQLESVVLKGRSIVSTAPLVEAMFMAELEHLLLTAGHDLDVVQAPITVDVAHGSETYVGIRGEELVLKSDDMTIADREGTLSSIIYGPDRRTQIRPETRRVLFTVYAPADINAGAVEAHLDSLQTYVRIVAPEATTDLLAVYA
jgi:DNA/RNA-binding domain of Phe-tRNA-synthetase-like protein